MKSDASPDIDYNATLRVLNLRRRLEARKAPTWADWQSGKITNWDQWRIGNELWKTGDLRDSPKETTPPPSRYNAQLCFIAAGVWLVALAVAFK